MTRKSVLIAEDNSEWQRVIAGILEEAYEVVGLVGRGDEVIAAANRHQPDVVSLDVSLPGISGMNLLPALRAALPDALIVIVSATADDLYRREALERGADAYIRKSNVRELLGVFRDCQASGQRTQRYGG